MSESLSNNPDGDPWFDEVKRSPDGEWVTIRPHGSEVDFIIPTRTGFDFIDNPPEGTETYE